MALEAPTVSDVMSGREANGSALVVDPSSAEVDPKLAADQPAENLGAVRTHALRIRLLAFDFIAAGISWIGFGFILAPGDNYLEKTVRGCFALGSTLIAMHAGRMYRSRMCAKWGQEFERIVLAAVVGSLAFAASEWPARAPRARDAVLCSLICTTTMVAFRGHYRRWLAAQRARGYYQRNVVLVGGDDESLELWNMLQSEPELGYRVTAVIGASNEPWPWDSLLRSTRVADLSALACETGASGVVIALKALSNDELKSVIAICSECGLHMQIWPGSLGVGSVRLREVPVSGEPLYYIEPNRIHRWQRLIKRAIDIGGSSLGILVFSPVLAITAIAIKLERGGSILHRQRRVGLNGVPFTVYKLRTMAVGAEEAVDELQALNQRTDGPLYKNDRDPRITKLGRLLRPLSIDELPQLWNVFLGSMSLVGPRPALPHEVLQFDDELQRRHTMRPGITGLWQSKARENPSFNAYRRYDLYYIANWSIRLDLSILAGTVPAVFAQAARALRGIHPKSESRWRTKARQSTVEDLQLSPISGMTLPRD